MMHSIGPGTNSRGGGQPKTAYKRAGIRTAHLVYSNAMYSGSSAPQVLLHAGSIKVQCCFYFASTLLLYGFTEVSFITSSFVILFSAHGLVQATVKLKSA